MQKGILPNYKSFIKIYVLYDTKDIWKVKYTHMYIKYITHTRYAYLPLIKKLIFRNNIYFIFI